MFYSFNHFRVLYVMFLLKNQKIRNKFIFNILPNLAITNLKTKSIIIVSKNIYDNFYIVVIGV